MPRYEFTSGQVLTADQMNDLSDQTVMTFAGTAARGSAIPSPTEGMVTYRSDDNVVEVFDGSAFVGVGGGKILQVVSTAKTDAFTMSGTVLTDITGLSASITPSATSSKILVLASVAVAGVNGVNGALTILLRGATPIAVSDSAGSRAQTTSFSETFGPHTSQTTNVSFLDSPSTTSAVTYKFQTSSNGAATVFVNRGQVDTDNSGFGRSVSTITLMEVAG